MPTECDSIMMMRRRKRPALSPSPPPSPLAEHCVPVQVDQPNQPSHPLFSTIYSVSYFVRMSRGQSLPLTPLKLVCSGVSGSRGSDVGGWKARSGGRGGSDGGDNFR